MKERAKVVLSAAALLFACESLSAKALYVASSGDGTTMSDWATAAPTIQAAFDAAAADADVDVIYVKGGSYEISAQLDWPKHDLALRGGYDGNDTGGLPGTRDLANNRSTVTAAEGYWGRLVRIAEKDNAVLEGFELTGAYFQGYGGIDGCGLGLYASNAVNTQVISCDIHDNWQHAKESTDDRASYGVGVCIGYGSASLVDTKIHHNKHDKDTWAYSYDSVYGIGVCVQRGARVSLTNCEIHDNVHVTSWYQGYGAGLAVGDTGSVCALTNCLFYKNQLQKVNADSGDAIHAGVIRQWGACGTLIASFCTFAYNGTRGLYFQGGTAELSDCIFYGHTEKAVFSKNAAPTMTAVMAEDDTGTIKDDAKIVRNYYLDADSPAIDESATAADDLPFAPRYAAIGLQADSGPADLGYHHTASQETAAETYFVDPENGNDENDGATSASAFKTLTHAVSKGVSSVAVKIVGGTCSLETGETFPIVIDGGMNLTISGPAGGRAVIDAQGAESRVFQIVSSAGVKFENLCVCNGRMTGTSGALAHGGGIRVAQSSAIEFSDCVISNNMARYNNNSSVGGGGLALIASSVKLTRCQIVRNGAYVGYMANARPLGCGLYLQDSSSADLTDCVIARNFYENNGSYSSAETYGTAVYLDTGSSGKMANCLVYGHYGRESAISGSEKLEIVGCTVADNACAAFNKGNVKVMDSILAANFKPFYDDATTAENCWIGDDPGFIDGYHLLAGSPAEGLGYTYPTETTSVSREVWVSASGDDANAGTEASPYRTITKALSGVNDRLTVHIGSGVYDLAAGEAFPIRLVECGGVRLVGAGPDQTVIDATGASANALRVVCSARVSIEGLTIRSARVRPVTSGVSMENRIGAAGLDFFATPVASVRDCVISNNWNEIKPGGGLAVRNTFLTLTDSRIADNISENKNGNLGGGICVSGQPSSLLMDRCVIADNKGSGFYFDSNASGASVEMRNSLILRNAGKSNVNDGGVMLNGGSGAFVADGCTFVGNGNYAVFRHQNATLPTVRNSILWDSLRCETNGVITLEHDCIKGAEADPETGVVTADPCFKDATKDDYSLMWASPCLNAGVNSSWMTGAVDLKNEPRIKRRIVDMGCYEYQLGGLMLMVR